MNKQRPSSARGRPNSRGKRVLSETFRGKAKSFSGASATNNYNNNSIIHEDKRKSADIKSKLRSSFIRSSKSGSNHSLPNTDSESDIEVSMPYNAHTENSLWNRITIEQIRPQQSERKRVPTLSLPTAPVTPPAEPEHKPIPRDTSGVKSFLDWYKENEQEKGNGKKEENENEQKNESKKESANENENENENKNENSEKEMSNSPDGPERQPKQVIKRILTNSVYEDQTSQYENRFTAFFCDDEISQQAIDTTNIENQNITNDTYSNNNIPNDDNDSENDSNYDELSIDDLLNDLTGNVHLGSNEDLSLNFTNNKNEHDTNKRVDNNDIDVVHSAQEKPVILRDSFHEDSSAHEDSSGHEENGVSFDDRIADRIDLSNILRSIDLIDESESDISETDSAPNVDRVKRHCSGYAY